MLALLSHNRCPGDSPKPTAVNPLAGARCEMVMMRRGDAIRKMANLDDDDGVECVVVCVHGFYFGLFKPEIIG